MHRTVKWTMLVTILHYINCNKSHIEKESYARSITRIHHNSFWYVLQIFESVLTVQSTIHGMIPTVMIVLHLRNRI